MQPLRVAAVLTGCLLVSVWAPACDAQRPAKVSLGSEALAGLYWEPPERLAAAALLLGGEGPGKEDWIPLATRLHREGYAVLALDLSEPARANPERLLAETRAGFEFLRGQKKVDAARIGLIGAAGGADAALGFAAAEPLARLVVLLSPGQGERGLPLESVLRDYGARPLLLVAAEKDEASAEVLPRLVSAAQGEAVVKLYPAAAHGTELLKGGLTVTEDLLAFLRTRL